MSFVDPVPVTLGEFVSEDDWNTLVNDMLFLRDRLNPVGSLLDYAGPATGTPGAETVVAAGYLLCNGAQVSRTTYAALFAVIGGTYGNGNGSTTFTLPDLRQRVALGKADAGTGSTLGAYGGSKDAVAVSHDHPQDEHTHGQTNHDHGVTDNGHNHAGANGFVYAVSIGGPQNDRLAKANEATGPYITFSDVHSSGTGIDVQPGPANLQGATANNQETGVSGTDANLPPYVVLNRIIKF